jgi:hypothetical protein
MRYSLIIFIAVLVVACTPAPKLGELSDQPKTNKDMDIYWLIGQSNMAGRGEITPALAKEMDEHVLMLDSNSNWVIAKHPLHFDKPSVAGVGPGLSFGIQMKKDNAHSIGLVPAAVGGTSIDVWRPGAFDKATNTHPWDDAVARLTTAMKSGHLKGVIWLQGESDSSPEKAKDYMKKLLELVNRIRVLANNPKLPFVAGEIGHFKDQYNNINSQLPGLTVLPYTGIATSEGLVDKGDKTHFDGPSADAYGKRFAEAMKKVQQQQ